LFSAVISQHFSKNRMIISVVGAKIWYLKMYGFYWATLYYATIMLNKRRYTSDIAVFDMFIES